MPRPRSRRPPTSQSSRTSSAIDDYAFSTPGTASSSSSPYFTTDNPPQALPAALHAHYAQYHYPDDPDTLDGVTEEDEEDEESDAEDVFAYLPPTTADQQSDPPGHQHQLHFSRAHPQAESPPDTNSSYDHVQGPDALRMHPVVTPTFPQNDASPPYSHPRSPLHLKTSPLGAKQLHVALPTSTAHPSSPGPSQPTQSYFLPGTAYDNPYQFTLSQMSNSVPPSTQGSTFSGSEGLRHRHNINVGVTKRTKQREKGANLSTDDSDDIYKEPSAIMEGSSVAKLVSNDIASLEYAQRSRRLEDGALEDGTWSNREGSIK